MIGLLRLAVAKNTLHDTVGITYQVQTQDVLDFNWKENTDHVEITAVTAETKKQKRYAFESVGLNIQPTRNLK